MKCEDCHENEAEVLITEVNADGKLQEKHLCKSCAVKKGYVTSQDKPMIELFVDFLKEKGTVEDEKIKCSSCGMSWADFRRHGRLGCADCYANFSTRIEKLIDRIQSTSYHTGRSAKKKTHNSPVFIEQEIKRLRRDLAKAISDEEYEKAARLRDDLKKYEERSE